MMAVAGAHDIIGQIAWNIFVEAAAAHGLILKYSIVRPVGLIVSASHFESGLL